MQQTYVSDINIPTVLYQLRFCDGSQRYVFKEELSHLTRSRYTKVEKISVVNTQQKFRLTYEDGSSEIGDLTRLLQVRPGDNFLEVDPAPEISLDGTGDGNGDNDGSGDGGVASTGFQVSYFVHDHLGNTRILYHTVLDCENSEVNYLLEHVVDYYPYGKVLREHTNCEDARYLTTHHERDKETDLDYRGARFYDSDIGRFLSLDPLAMEFPGLTAYSYVAGNPAKLVDPDGEAPIDPNRIGFSFGFKFSFSGQYSFNLAVGGSFGGNNFMSAINISTNVYNSGLGTVYGSTGELDTQVDIIASLSVTAGIGRGKPMPLNTFSNSSLSAITNEFGSSFSLGTNFVNNLGGSRDQRVGYVGVRGGDFSFNLYNDFLPYLGDGEDRFWTGGGSVQMGVEGDRTVSIGKDVFTGLRIRNPNSTSKNDRWKIWPGNPANGKYGTYLQYPWQQLLNNGQTQGKMQLGGVGLQVGTSSGSNNMGIQNGIHDHPLFKDPSFYSSAK